MSEDLKAPSVGGSALTLSPAQAVSAMENWVAAGNDPQVFIAAAAHDGINIVEDGRNDATRAFDAAFPSGPPQAYKIGWAERIDGMGANEVAALNDVATQALSAMAFSPAMGKSFIEDAYDDARMYASMSAAEQKMWDAQQSALVGRVLKGEAPTAMTNARALLGALKERNPQAYDKLVGSKHLKLDSARVIIALHNHAETMLQRASLGG